MVIDDDQLRGSIEVPAVPEERIGSNVPLAMLMGALMKELDDCLKSPLREPQRRKKVHTDNFSPPPDGKEGDRSKNERPKHPWNRCRMVQQPVIQQQQEQPKVSKRTGVTKD